MYQNGVEMAFVRVCNEWHSPVLFLSCSLCVGNAEVLCKGNNPSMSLFYVFAFYLEKYQGVLQMAVSVLCEVFV